MTFTKPQKAQNAFWGLRPPHFDNDGFIKKKVFVLRLPRDLVELRGRIRNEFAAITKDMLMRVWTEMEYCLDICRVTKDALIESL
ncbi:uncharacterized protein TNIN_162941 [Trichonephila inaurata madagascariensis]|uniref:Uncharacterized protein n=1 Tax=Trichonephila inaurata madagascariensis TaxID=2747483 RepID=A0A8X7CBB5_9ARAC|nr:uncharacterized protein TNIN_162941 [Trichonephila inaurata madagascariensis]